MTKSQIIDYIITSPQNTNKAVLINMLLIAQPNFAESVRDKIVNYVMTNSSNINITILGQLIDNLLEEDIIIGDIEVGG